jgi:hypothetical protein
VVIQGPGGAVQAVPFRMIHGPTEAIGFRFGSLAYAPDVSVMPPESIDRLCGLEVLIVDALALHAAPDAFLRRRRARVDQRGPATPGRAHEPATATSTTTRLAASCRTASCRPFDGMQIEV